MDGREVVTSFDDGSSSQCTESHAINYDRRIRNPGPNNSSRIRLKRIDQLATLVPLDNFLEIRFLPVYPIPPGLGDHFFSHKPKEKRNEDVANPHSDSRDSDLVILLPTPRFDDGFNTFTSPCFEFSKDVLWGSLGTSQHQGKERGIFQRQRGALTGIGRDLRLAVCREMREGTVWAASPIKQTLDLCQVGMERRSKMLPLKEIEVASIISMHGCIILRP